MTASARILEHSDGRRALGRQSLLLLAHTRPACGLAHRERLQLLAERPDVQLRILREHLLMAAELIGAGCPALPTLAGHLRQMAEQ